MNSVYKIAGILTATSLTAYSQSLFVEDPNEDEKSTIPLTYEVGASIGYDDNFSPTLDGAGSESEYINAYVGARMVNITPQTTWKFNTKISATKYFGSNDSEDIYANARLGFDWNHQINERTRLVSRSYINYGLEPEYTYAFTTARRPTEHLFFATDTSVGHRWTNRFATYTGVRISGVYYDGDQGTVNDRFSWAAYNTFRFGWSPQTNLLAEISYGQTNSSGSAGDSTNIIGSVGVEHRFSPYSVAIVKVGTQYRDVDGGRDAYYNPYFESSVRTQLNEQLSVKAYAKYSVEDYETSQGAIAYDTGQTLRVGLDAIYQISDRVSLNGGVNYIANDFTDGRDTSVSPNTAAQDADQSLINPFIGFTWQMTEQVSLNGSYNFTTADASDNLPFRGYDRNRFQLGVNASF